MPWIERYLEWIAAIVCTLMVIGIAFGLFALIFSYFTGKW